MVNLRPFRFALAVLALSAPVFACSAFCAANKRLVLVGNNEDDNNPFTVMWFVPASKGTLGRVYVGYDNFDIQGGMNERGLWFDAFATPLSEAKNSANKPVYQRNLVDKAMSECSTVAEVVRLYEQYNLDYMKYAVLMFADASGDSVIIEPNAVLRRKGPFQVQTNIHQSLPVPEYRCERFELATAMLKSAGENISVDLFRRILAATHQEDPYPTVYSNIYDLKRRVMYLYHFHNFENVVKVDLGAELKKGARAVAIPTLFPESHAETAYRRGRAKAMNRVAPPVVKVDPSLFDDYAGKYRLTTGVHFEILRVGDKLMLDADPLGRVEMYPESPSRFFLKITDAHVSFLRGADGRVNEVSATIQGKEARGPRTP